MHNCGEGISFSQTDTPDDSTFTGQYTVSGTSLQITYDMYDNPDRLVVQDAAGAVIYDSGYVGTAIPLFCYTFVPVVDSGNGCQGMSGKFRPSQTLKSPCPNKDPISIPIASSVYFFTVYSPCAGSGWDLLFKCT